MKKVFSLIAVLLCFCALSGCTVLITKPIPGDKEQEPEIKQESIVTEENGQEKENDETVPNPAILEIPVESISGITSHEAEELCYSVMGEKDEETGFIFSFGTSGAIEKDGKQYYVIRASWLVDNSHMSYIGDFFVTADGKELYSGTALGGEYEIVSKVWSESSDE